MQGTPYRECWWCLMTVFMCVCDINALRSVHQCSWEDWVCFVHAHGSEIVGSSSNLLHAVLHVSNRKKLLLNSGSSQRCYLHYHLYNMHFYWEHSRSYGTCKEKAMAPAVSPFASTNVLAVSSNLSHISMSLIPGLITRCINLRVCLWEEGSS